MMAFYGRWKIVLLVFLFAFLQGKAQTPTKKGEQLLRKYFDHQTQQIAKNCLSDINSLSDWKAKRPEYRRQFLEMMGLWPLPAKTKLRATITGKIETDKFTVEKIHFQSSPGLYVTGNLYIPKNLKAPAPTILYVCGHARTIDKGVSYGNHVNYQHHPRWFAEHGYVCFIIDTLQLGEIQGIHHGTWPKYNMWWWHTLGYTPAGIECWNGIRALDYLVSRKEVDPKRIGLTGRSGGGATSWWIAAADERPACIIPVAGIADIRSHVYQGVHPRYKRGIISGHCDCMYLVNTYRWDFAQVAALCAPRPLMLANSDNDSIFPVLGYRRLAEKVRKIYRLHKAEDRFTLLETVGPHKDTPALRLGAFSWMERWLKNDGKVVKKLEAEESPRFTPQQLKVLDTIPEDAINALIQDVFIKPARPELPKSPKVAEEWWKSKRIEWLQALNNKVFRGWTKNPPPLHSKLVADKTENGLRLRSYDFTSETGVELRLWLMTAAKVKKPKLVVLTAVDEAGWQEWQQELSDPKKMAVNRRVLEKFSWGFATVAPRGIGPTAWAEPGSLRDHHIKRRFPLLGQTLDGQRVWDVRRALAVLRGLPDLKKVPLWLQGKGNMAGIVLYAAIFEPDIPRLDLWELPSSHKIGPVLLNVRKTLEISQALALAFPRRIYIYERNKESKSRWAWPLELQESLGHEFLKIRIVKKSS